MPRGRTNTEEEPNGEKKSFWDIFEKIKEALDCCSTATELPGKVKDAVDKVKEDRETTTVCNSQPEN
jgi:hypothetical protein